MITLVIAQVRITRSLSALVICRKRESRINSGLSLEGKKFYTSRFCLVQIVHHSIDIFIVGIFIYQNTRIRVHAYIYTYIHTYVRTRRYIYICTRNKKIPDYSVAISRIAFSETVTSKDQSTPVSLSLVRTTKCPRYYVLVVLVVQKKRKKKRRKTRDVHKIPICSYKDDKGTPTNEGGLNCATRGDQLNLREMD